MVIDAIFAMASDARGPGFSLDPEWLPDPAAPDRPLMLTRMRAFVAHPCDEIDAIVERAAELEQSEPDPTRYTSPTRRALRLREDVASFTSMQGEESVCRALKKFVPELDDAIETIATMSAWNWNIALAKYYELERQLLAVPTNDPRSIPAMLAFRALQYYAAETQTQCARYEETTGTAVGMTMFYTDLLAKLWMSIDHGLSAPTLQVAGFVIEPRIELTSVLAASIEKNQDTRFWFGPRPNGVSRTTRAGTSILFDHSFARIFAAGSDPARPGIEARPNEAARRAIGWWDHHYDDVADYEQEFHRLNQIMKWSLITGALSDAGIAQYLKASSPRRDHVFGEWVRANQPRLRFAGSIPVSTSTSPGKECVPIFESYDLPGRAGGISGGVGAATRQSLPRVPVVNPAKPIGARKPQAASSQPHR